MSGLRKTSDIALFRRLISEARPFWPHIAGLFALSLLSVPLTLLIPLPLKIAIDSVLGSHEVPATLAIFLPAGVNKSDWHMVMVVAALIILIALAKQLVDLLLVILRSYTAEHLVLAFRAK